MAKIHCGVWIMDKFMWRKRKAFLKEECEDMIEKFEQTPFKDKNAEDIECDFKYFDNYRQYSCLPSDFSNPDWSDVGVMVVSFIKEYAKEHPFLFEEMAKWGLYGGFHVQKYEPGHCYQSEHMEHGITNDSEHRMHGWMVYLNDCDGGTYWPSQNFTSKPRTGDFYIWPAGWTHSHRGISASTIKYILTGWTVMKEQNDALQIIQ